MGLHSIQLSDDLWNGMVAVAERKSRTPQTLARQAIKDYLQRVEDDELLSRTIAAARRSGVTIREAEAAIKTFRHQRRRKGNA